ncbi:MAG TPA: thioesterase family protein [Polaromonas sp.]
MNAHSFDEAVRLQVADPAQPDVYTGTSSPAYWNMVGPFGGTTAATALQAVMQHPARLGEPIALTVNYAAALGAGPFTLTARPVRTNRSTQHWTVEIAQVDASGADGVVLTATIVTAARRETWSQNDMPMPPVPAPLEVTRQQFIAGVEWINRYDMRPVRGAIPQVWDGSGQDSVTQLWVRDDPPRALDFSALAAMADVFYPRVWLRRAHRVPAGTVSMTVYFHADSRQLAQCGQGYLLGQARGQAFRNGFFDQSAQLWSEAGKLLVTSSQIVYYKE